MMPFEPAGERARWRTVYDFLCLASVGDVVTYEMLGEALGADPETERHKIQMAVRRAAKEYLTVDKRALRAVPNKGYEVVDAAGHLVLSRRHQSKAVKALQRGHSTAVNVDLSGVEPQVRHALEVVAQGFALQMDYNRRFDVRQKRLEDALADVTKRSERTQAETERTQAEVAELRARLERLEN
jgi:hypothetical protein